MPAHLAAMSSRRDLVELLLPHSGLGPDIGLEAVMARGKVGALTLFFGAEERQAFFERLRLGFVARPAFFEAPSVHLSAKPWFLPFIIPTS